MKNIRGNIHAFICSQFVDDLTNFLESIMVSHFIWNFAFGKLYSSRNAKYENVTLLCVLAFMLAERTLPSRHKPVI